MSDEKKIENLELNKETVQDLTESEAEHAKEMLYWLCRGRRFYAGQRGSVVRLPVRRSRVS